MTRVPLFPLGTLLVPGQVLTLNVFEKRYRRLVADLQKLPVAERAFGVVAIVAGHEVGDGDAVRVADVGTMAHIRHLQHHPSGTIGLTAVGRSRFRLNSRHTSEAGYDVAEVELLPDSRQPASDVATSTMVLAQRAARHLRALLELVGRPVPELPESPDPLSFAVLLAAPLDPAEQHRLLGIDATEQRLLAEIQALRREQHLVTQLRALARSGPIALPSQN